jgi:hypothetical protein
MSEYSDEHAEIAISILLRAHDELIERGFGEVEACHALVHAGVGLAAGVLLLGSPRRRVWRHR